MVKNRYLPIGALVRINTEIHGDDGETFPTGTLGCIVSHGSLGYMGVEVRIDGAPVLVNGEPLAYLLDYDDVELLKEDV